MTVEGGATLNATFLNIGRGDATGTVIVDGAGTQVTLKGADAAGTGAGVTIGRDNNSSGTLTVRNGATLAIDGSGPNVLSAGFNVARDSGTTATINLESGARMTISAGDTQGLTGVTLGTAGVGSMNISGGASLKITGNEYGGGLTIGRLGTGNLKITDGGGITITNPTTASTHGTRQEEASTCSSKDRARTSCSMRRMASPNRLCSAPHATIMPSARLSVDSIAWDGCQSQSRIDCKINRHLAHSTLLVFRRRPGGRASESSARRPNAPRVAVGAPRT